MFLVVFWSFDLKWHLHFTRFLKRMSIVITKVVMMMVMMHTFKMGCTQIPISTLSHTWVFVRLYGIVFVIIVIIIIIIMIIKKWRCERTVLEQILMRTPPPPLPSLNRVDRWPGHLHDILIGFTSLRSLAVLGKTLFEKWNQRQEQVYPDKQGTLLPAPV